MNRLLFILVLMISTALHAQNVDVDKKTGIVKVDGKEAFIIETIGKGGAKGYSVQNLAKKEFVFVQNEVVGQSYNQSSRRMQDDVKMRFTFTATGNSCLVSSPILSFSYYKIIATVVARGRLLENESVSLESERRFVVSNGGQYRPVEQPVVVQVSAPAPATAAVAASIQVKGNRIYNHDEAIGSFKQSTDGGFEVIQVYSSSDQKVAVARHAQGKPDEDWSITLSADNRNVSVLYNTATPLERLFQYLTEKGILK
ncbi:MAG: hypothetical protein EOO15_08560 [Chitinophagaceae bacterium]|nr:MAG: hypothetical protein EOO15_08560 [Chitinophagaceae bacterium]